MATGHPHGSGRPTAGETLRREDIGAIHGAGLRILEVTGLVFQDEETVDRLRRRGCAADGQRVRIPTPLVEAALESAPAHFELESRGGRPPLTVGGGTIVATTGGNSFVLDGDTLRMATHRDLESLTKLAHVSESIDVVSLAVDPQDLPAAHRYPRALYTLLTLTDKPLAVPGFDRTLSEAVVTSAEIIWGERWQERARVLTVFNSTSPLVFECGTCRGLTALARLGQPVCLTPCVMGGTTGPATVAGILALQHAESLAGLVLSQVAREGTPFIYGGTSSLSSMSTGDLLVGVPQYWTLMAATVQIAHHLGLPCRAGGGLTDSHLPDMQAGIESAMGLAEVARAGVDLVIHGTGVMSSLNAVSFEKFIVDDELVAMIRTRNLPVEVDAETLALDVIDGVGPGGVYLLEEHTARHCRDHARSTFFNRRRRDVWQRRGGRDLATAARLRFDELIDAYEPPELEPDVRRRLAAHLLGETVPTPTPCQKPEG